MATTKPRITITLNDQTYAVLRAISECGGQPMSTFVAEMLDSARPTLERMAATFQKIKAAQDAERARFLENIDEAQAAIEPVVMEAMGQFDLFLGRIDKAVDGIGDRDACGAGALAASTAAAGKSPPTNRGDTPMEGKRLQAKRGKASKPVSRSKVSKKTAG